MAVWCKYQVSQWQTHSTVLGGNTCLLPLSSLHSLLLFAFNSQQNPSINLLAILVGAGILQLWALVSGGIYKNWCLDALEGSFARYWPGLILVICFVLLLLFAFNSQQNPSINLLAILVGAAILQLWAWVSGGVYKNWCLDALEGSFAVNLIML